ncbi:SCO3374 family protein [Streptomyces sp. NRRL S-87]|uniref:SCO3374 family protein n=1 Tax=Streptomyces sp. NRRL S-87 TaxID=1463920 RepID=UPI0004BF2414|nr:SCO3374 family protein [Streptomyces sp. NRRL S-87]
MALTVPPPRAPLGAPYRSGAAQAALVHWYAHVLGWPVAEPVPGGPPVQLLTGVRFDVLELPADAGYAVLRRGVPTGPVALMGRRMRLLVAAGSADELPGLLEWLEWGGVALDLTALGAGGRITAPEPPGPAGGDPAGAAVWLRPPEPGCEALLPSLAAVGGGTGRGVPGAAGAAPDLARLAGAAATECHRARLARAGNPARAGQPLAFS